tara:strand:+ start:238 stop:627 length:390 start_codon:yes stop_codon:yes gene_type:complete
MAATLAKTVMGLDSNGNQRKELEIYHFQDNGGQDVTFECHGATRALFMSNRALTPKLPQVNYTDASAADYGEINTSEAGFTVAAASGVVVASAAGEAGHIAEAAMPPFFVLTVGGADSASISFCYIYYI